MRWLLTNQHIHLADALINAGEDVVGNAADYQVAHLDWLADLVERLVPPGEPDPVGAVFQHPEADADRMALTADYPLNRVLVEHRPDVLVLTPFYEPGFGFPLGSISRWMNMAGGGRPRVLVGLGRDPEAWDAAVHRRYRGCACRMEHLIVYVTNDETTARRSAGERRTAVWRPGESIAGVLAAVAHAASMNPYQAGTQGRVFT